VEVGGHGVRGEMYQDVKNSAALREEIISKKLQVSLLDAKMILDVFQVLIAAKKALYSADKNSLATHGCNGNRVNSARID